jgi:hypothetical protein
MKRDLEIARHAIPAKGRLFTATAASWRNEFPLSRE